MKTLKNHITIDNKSYDELSKMDKLKFDKMCDKLKGLEKTLEKKHLINISTQERVLTTMSPTFPQGLYGQILEAFKNSEF